MGRKPPPRSIPGGEMAGRHPERQHLGDVSVSRDRTNLFYRWKDEAERGAKAALGGRRPRWKRKKDQRIRQLERTLGRKSLEIEILKNVVGGVSCGAVHSLARQLVTEGYTATPVAETLAISRFARWDRGVQSRPASPRSRKSHSARGLLGFCN